jgi:hypothetical protein
MNYTINLTEQEQLALEFVMYDVSEWIENFTQDRARVATDEIVGLTVEKCLSNNVPVPGSKIDIIKLAYEQGWIQSAKTRTD